MVIISSKWEKDRLPVYNKLRQLFEQLESSTKKVPINIKRGKIAEVENLIMAAMVKICYADAAKDDSDASIKERLDFIDEVQQDLNEIKVNVRLLHDLKYIKDQGFDALAGYEDNVDSQLIGWRNATEKRLKVENK